MYVVGFSRGVIDCELALQEIQCGAAKASGSSRDQHVWA